MRYLLSLGALLLAPLPAAPVLAQEDPVATEAEQDDPYSRFYYAIQSGVDQEIIIANALAEVERQFRTEPTMSALEEQSPGLIREVVKAMAPFVRQMQARVNAEYAPQMIAVVRETFTYEEASQLADFYSSELGQRFALLIAQNYSVGNVLEDALVTDKITADQIERDQVATVGRFLGALEPEDMVAMERAMRDYPAIAKLGEFRGATMPIRLRMENADPTPEEQRMLEAALESVFNARFPQ